MLLVMKGGNGQRVDDTGYTNRTVPNYPLSRYLLYTHAFIFEEIESVKQQKKLIKVQVTYKTLMSD